MRRVTFDRLRDILPDLEELRPVLDHALAISSPDPTRRWSGSGELGTSGQRLVDTGALREAARTIADTESTHQRRLYELVADAVSRYESGDATGAIEALLHAAALEEGRDRPGRAAAYADAAVRAGRGRNGDELSGRALRRRARAKRTAGRLDESERDYAKAFEIGRAIGDVPGAAEAAIGAGNVLEEQGRWSQAEAWYRRALRVLDEADAERPERWHALLNLHVALRWRGALDECVEPLERASATADELGDSSAIPFIENARGQLLSAQGRYAEAETHYRDALSASTGARASSTIRLNLAEALFAMDRRLEAAEAGRIAESEAIRASLPQKLPEVYRLLGRIAAAEGSPDAFVLFEHALELIETHGLTEFEAALTLQAYADVEAATGERESANELYQRADALYRRLGIRQRRSQWADRLEGEPPMDSNTNERPNDD